jgi:selenocysteine lyase/cysteine desulfurase/tRNA(Ile)-lysidine synthase TilS/MesJ
MASAYRSYGGIDDDEAELEAHAASVVAEAYTAEASAPAALSSKPASRSSTASEKAERVVVSVRQNIIGALSPFESPYGKTIPCVYADWTASGRALANIETYVAETVLPLYGNTHTSTSITGRQSTSFRHEARQIVAQSVNARITGKAAEDVVLFTGSGTTAAVSRLVASLGLHLPPPEALRADERHRPVVFTSAYEHHSNLLPWRESVAEVVTVRYHPTTGVDLVHLAELLVHFKDRQLKIGSFSAASNVTGILTAVDECSVLLHTHGALAFFDYATAAPYVRIDMNPVGTATPLAYKDAIVFSGHKFLGGPSSPGVLVVKKALLPQNDAMPNTPGGGTVFYVTDVHHRYLSNKEEREEGGTPYIVGDIRLGLVLHLKHSIGAAWIEAEELRINDDATRRLFAVPNLVLLGRRAGAVDKHLPIFSFLIRHARRFLHHNFVCALLNDLFGVQARGGCMCAGPFSQELLGISPLANKQIEAALLDKHEVLRPGYTRLSLPYWMDSLEIEHVLKAIEFVAANGFKFLSAYRYNPKTGDWAHSSRMTKFPGRLWLSNFAFAPKPGDSSVHASRQEATSDSSVADKASLFRETFCVAAAEVERIARNKERVGAAVTFALDDLRWFALPGDDASSLESPLGPICPELWDPLVAHAHGDGQAASSTDGATAYALKRASDSLVARSGSDREAALPRYVTFRPPTGALAAPGKPNSVLGHSATSLALQMSGGPASAPASEPGLERASPATCAIRPASSSASVEPLSEEKIMSSTGNTYVPIPGAPRTKSSNPPKKIMSMVGKAIKDWNLIEEGDSLLLGLSGGKDSLALLHILLAFQKKAPVTFSIACATVDPQTESFDPSPLIPYVQSLGVTYHYLSEPIVELAKSKLQGDSLCAFCSRFKRGLLYSCCRSNGYNKLVLAQHLDDLAESIFMSAMHNGQVRTMKANYKIEAGDVKVIRPLVYVREAATRDFSVQERLPIINENCPACFEQPKERHRMKKLLQQEEAMTPALFANLRRAFVPLMTDETYDAMERVVKAIEEAGKQPRVASLRASGGKRKREDDQPITQKRPGAAAAGNAAGGAPPVGSEEDRGAPCKLGAAYCAPCYELC